MQADPPEKLEAGAHNIRTRESGKPAFYGWIVGSGHNTITINPVATPIRANCTVRRGSTKSFDPCAGGARPAECWVTNSVDHGFE